MFIKKHLKKTVLTIALATTINPAMAEDYSVGITIGTAGLGITGSKKTNWHFLENDQIQLRFSFTGAHTNDGDYEVSDIQYDDAHIDLDGFQLGADWYPFANSVFFSGGIIKQDFSLKGTTRSDQSFIIGGSPVTPNDNVRVNSTIERSAVSPYLSVGWGNRIKETSGLSLIAELGIMSSAKLDVNLTATDPNSLLPANSLTNERQEIINTRSTVNAFASVGLNYHF